MSRNNSHTSSLPTKTGAASCRPLLVVALALFNKKGECLVSRRPYGKHFGGLWEFPGGKVETNETMSSALIREIKEELDITLQLKDFSSLPVASAVDGNMKLFLFKGCKNEAVTPKPLEGQLFKWVKPIDFKNLPMPPADILLCGQNWYNI